MNKVRNKLFIFGFISILFVFLFLPELALAKTVTNSFEATLTKIADYLKGLIIAAAALTMVLAAFFYTTSAGDPKKITKAKEYFYSSITALIALVIAFLFFK